MKLTANGQVCSTAGLDFSFVPQPYSTPGPLRACSFVRVSTEEQAQDGKAGLSRQRDAVSRVIAHKGYDLVHTVELVDVSGTATLMAPEVQELLSMVGRKSIDVVVVSEMSRLLRPDDLSSFSLLETCKRNGVLIDAGGTSHDLASPEGFISGGIQALLGGAERLQMLRRMKQSKEAKRAAGHCPGSSITLPTGVSYDRQKNRYYYTPEVAAVVEAFRLVDEQGIRNLSEIGRLTGLHERNVRNLLSNTIYAGVRTYKEKRGNEARYKANGRQADKAKVKRGADEIIIVRVFAPEEQAVSDERFGRVQQVLAELAESHSVWVAEKHKGSMLTGPGRCGVCASRLYSKTRSRKLADGTRCEGHYLCATRHEKTRHRKDTKPCQNGWIRKVTLDELASAFIERFLADQEFVDAVLEFARSKQENIVGFSVEDSVKVQLTELSKREQRILAALEAGAMSLEEVKQARARISEKRKALRQSLERAKPIEPPQDLLGLAGALEGGLERWRKLKTTRERKAFIASIFSELYFRHHDGGEITAFRLTPGLVGGKCGPWGFAAEMPVMLPQPFRLAPKEPEVPSGMRRCCRCREIKEPAEFYRDRPACRKCLRADCKARAEKIKHKGMRPS